MPNYIPLYFVTVMLDTGIYDLGHDQLAKWTVCVQCVYIGYIL